MDHAGDAVRPRRAQDQRGSTGVDPVKLGAIASPEIGDPGEMIDVPNAPHRGVETFRIEHRTGHECHLLRELRRRCKIEHPNGCAAAAQRRDHMASDETAAAGDEINRHAVAPARHGVFCGWREHSS
jgi:hypothetical protein